MLRFLTACYFGCLATQSQAVAQSDITLAELRARIQLIETEWERCSAEIIETNWAADGRQIGSNCREYFLLDNRFREQRYGARETGAKLPQFKMRQWDGTEETQVTPQHSIDLRDKPTELPPPSLPYGVILNAADCSGNLTHFLDEQSENPLEAEVTLIDGEQPRVRVRRRVRLAGDDKWDVIEIEFDSAAGLRPISLYRYRQIGASQSVAAGSETRLNVVKSALDANAVRYDFRIEGANSSTKASARVRTQRIRGQKLDADSAFPQIAIAEFMGNPAVRIQHGNQTSEAPLLPIDRPPAPPWSPFDKWLVINNVLMGILLFFRLLSKLREAAKRWTSEKAATNLPTAEGAS